MRAFFHHYVLLATSPRMIESLNTGLSLSPWVLMVRTYLFDDWQFLGFLLTLVLVDTVTGVLRSWHARQISSRSFSRIFTKLLVYLALLVTGHVMSNFTVHGKVNFFFQWFDTFIYCAMMAREALSVLENLGAVAPELVPKMLSKRLALFSEDPEAALRQLQAAALAPAPEPAAAEPPLDTISQPAPEQSAIIPQACSLPNPS